MKKDMNRTLRAMVLSLSLAMYLPGSAKAQGMPVYDNTNFISMTKSLLESAKQTSELLKTVAFLKEQQENIVKVSNTIKQLKAVQELAKNQGTLLQTVRNDLRDILDSPYIKPGEVEGIARSFELIIDAAVDDMDFVNQILTSDLFKMTDAERTALLMEKREVSRQMVAELEAKTRRYREIISFRKLQDLINNRKTQY